MFSLYALRFTLYEEHAPLETLHALRDIPSLIYQSQSNRSGGKTKKSSKKRNLTNRVTRGQIARPPEQLLIGILDAAKSNPGCSVAWQAVVAVGTPKIPIRRHTPTPTANDAI